MPAKVKFYGLSTCIHCKHALQFLDEHKVQYDHVFVDLLSGEERTKALNAVKELNPECSFPTMLIGKTVVVGFDPKAISEALENA